MEKLVRTKASAKKSKLQLKYEDLSRSIEEKKALLQQLEEGMQEALPLVIKELKPLLNRELEGFKKRLLRLDEVAEETSFGKSLRKSFEAYMLLEITHLLHLGLADDADLLELQQKYSFGHRSREIQQDEVHTPPATETPKKQTKKTDLLQEKEAKAVYLQLMKAFHPDRVQDAETKVKYNEISTQVIKSYKDKDFHNLLKLQIKHISDAEVNADTLLQRYNLMLQEQLGELEIALEKARAATRGIYEDLFDAQNRFSSARFKKVKKALRQNIDRLERDYVDSINHTKVWFKHVLAALNDW